MSSICEHVVDRLSSLPQDVLSYILSLMPTRFAVRTSLLSKTWRYTWTFVHNLDFDTNEDHKYLDPKDVDWVLECCKTSQIKIFRVQFSDLCYNFESYSGELISKAIRLKVHELEMKAKYLRLPSSLYTCKTLTKLKLDCIKSPSMDAFPNCPSLINLPNLKTLDVVIDGMYRESALKLIHGCPILENLYVRLGYWKNEGDAYFKIPTLKRLNLKVIRTYSNIIAATVVLNLPNLENFWFDGDGCMDFPFVNLPNLKTLDVVTDGIYRESVFKLIHGCPVLENLYVKMGYLNIEGGTYFKLPTLKRLNLKVSQYLTDTVVLNLPNLEYFLFDGFMGFPFVIKEMSSLIEAKVSCVLSHSDSEPLVQLLEGISQAKLIYLNIKDSSSSDDHLDLPKFFPKLKQLELEGYVGHQWNLIPQFLERSPKLEHLSIGTALHDYEWNKLKPIPTCMRVNLKTVKYKDGCGYHDLEFLKFVLSNSKVLKTLTVECDTKSSLILRANLTKLRKASINGEICLRFRSSINKTRPELTESRDRHISTTFCTTTLAQMNTTFRIMFPTIFLYFMLVPFI